MISLLGLFSRILFLIQLYGLFLHSEITNNYILIKDLLFLGSREKRRQIETMLSVLGKPRDSMYLPEHMESHKLLHVIKT